MEQLLDKISKAPAAAKYGGLAGVVIVLSALNFFLVIQPLEDSIAQQQERMRQLDRQLAEKQEIAQNLNERRREMDTLEQKLAEALTELPEKKEIDELLTQINDIGKRSGLEGPLESNRIGAFRIPSGGADLFQRVFRGRRARPRAIASS